MGNRKGMGFQASGGNMSFGWMETGNQRSENRIDVNFQLIDQKPREKVFRYQGAGIRLNMSFGWMGMKSKSEFRSGESDKCRTFRKGFRTQVSAISNPSAEWG